MIDKVLKIFAWIGFGFFSLCNAYNIYGLWLDISLGAARHTDADMYPVFCAISIIGLIPMLVGGMIGKPRGFRSAAIIAGAIYLITEIIYGIWGEFNNSNIHSGTYGMITGILSLALLSIPGLLCLAAGFWLKHKEQEKYFFNEI